MPKKKKDGCHLPVNFLYLGAMLRLGCLIIGLGMFFVNAQIHNRVLKINSGVSYEQFIHKKTFETINDTSSHQFEMLTVLPTFSYSHEFVMSDVISLGGRAGFQYMNAYYDHQHYGTPYAWLSANAIISIFYRKGFEYYVKLQAGLTFWFHRPGIITDQMRRLFPDHVNVFTGVTVGGFNYFITDHLGLNLELSIWSPEMATFGLSYRFYKGELPEIQETKEL
jgi:hypothetical protein